MLHKICKTIALVLLPSTLLISCKKYLDYDSASKYYPSTVYSTTDGTNSALMGVYSELIGDNGYGQRLSIFIPQSADDFKTSGSYSATDRRGISLYGASPYNSELYNPFIQLYKGIEKANLCIKYIQQSPLYTGGSDADKSTMKCYLGEALTVRAVFYLELIRNWGDVPAYFEPAEDRSDLYGANTDRDSTYDHLLADLKDAEDMVPWRSQLPGYVDFRITKGAIKGIRARTALYRGGYSLRTASHKMERRSDYLKYYQIAYDECKDLLSNRSEHTLNPNFENVFKTLHTTTRLDDAHELMFEVAAYGNNANTDSKLAYANGIKYNAASTYGSAGGNILAVPTYFYDFDSYRDCRRDVTIGSWQINASTQVILNTLTTMTDAKFRKSWTAFNSSSTSQNYNINWPVLRFSDVLLMFAEADNELNNGPSADAVNALQEVQKRAYLGYENDIPAAPTDKDGFFKSIVKERLLEFGGEGFRKYDLIRWNMLSSQIDTTKAKLTRLAEGTGEYANVPLNIYAIPTTYLKGTSVAEVANMNLYGGTPNTVFQKLDPSSSPNGYSMIQWRTAATVSNTVSNNSTGFAYYFQAGHSELLPYPASAMIENPTMQQNYGY
ncbi:MULTISPECIES: RagB/SusD family nutrient uptake outer membrane protein [Chitinophagaceae]